MEGKLGAPQLSLADTTPVKCDACGGEIFEQGIMLREVSALLTGNGKPGVITVPVFICSKCGHVNKQFLPVELQNNEQS